MTTNASVFGSKINLIASSTFPAGITITQFSDDADPFDLPNVKIGDAAMGSNGDLIAWSKSAVLTTTISLVPGSNDDKNLTVLFNANFVGRGRRPANDKILMVVTCPNGALITLSEGVITDGSPGFSGSSAGRIKTKTYTFSFEAIDVVNI